MSSLPKTPVMLTVDELEAYTSRHGRCELIEGAVIHLSPSSAGHGMYTGRLHIHLGHFVSENNLGEVFAAETGFREGQKQTVRAPDIAFIQTARLPDNPTGFSETMPDLLVEVVSPNDRMSEVSAKTAWWLKQPGVRLVWEVEPESRQVTAYRPDGTARVYGESDSLNGGDVVRGFSLELKRLFR